MLIQVSTVCSSDNFTALNRNKSVQSSSCEVDSDKWLRVSKVIFDLRHRITSKCIAFTMVSAKASSLPRLGLGMAALGRPGYINLNRSSILGSDNRNVATMQEQANVVMDRLFSLSVDSIAWLDCARSYGLSEKFVGEYLKSNHIKPDEVYVSSKWGYTVSGFVQCHRRSYTPSTFFFV